MKHLFAAVLSLLALWAGTLHAHPGHDMPGVSHWHATDVLGYVAVAAAAVAAGVVGSSQIGPAR